MQTFVITLNEKPLAIDDTYTRKCFHLIFFTYFLDKLITWDFCTIPNGELVDKVVEMSRKNINVGRLKRTVTHTIIVIV